MNNLSNTVYQEYLGRFTELPFDKQFHFASRLYLWDRDPAMRPLLDNLRAEFTEHEQSRVALQNVLETARQTATHGSKNAAELRKPYFEKYPNLKPYVSVLFRTVFLKTVYNIDARDFFTHTFAEAEVKTLADNLLADSKATAILSTHAVNFLYLYQRFILENETSSLAKQFVSIGQTQYDHDNPIHMQLLIYLYTHCIIGESLFYYRALPEKTLPIYHTMLDELEKLIDKHFIDINLDNKFEYLVCVKLAGYKTTLTERIFAEAEKSISNEGKFIIDRHNNNPQIINTSLDKSEHRNVLFIMANRSFTSTL